MPTRVWLLRHAETAAPLVFHGAESDIGLSPLGEEQARAVAERLSGERPAAIISSGMKRAILTATPIAAAHGMTVRIEPTLHERRVGGLSGLAYDAVDSPWPETLRRWTEGDTAYTPDGAESWDDMKARLFPTWERLTAEFDGQSIVVVAHGLVCKVLLMELLPGWSVADWYRLGPIRNTAVHELVGGDRAWQAITINGQPAVQ